MRKVFKVGLVLSLCVGGAAFADDMPVVDQAKLKFSQEEITIKRGEKIRFTNNDRTPHNLMIKSGGKFFNSGIQPPGEDAIIPFEKAGDFMVVCGIHPKMKLAVTVEK